MEVRRVWMCACLMVAACAPGRDIALKRETPPSAAAGSPADSLIRAGYAVYDQSADSARVLWQAALRAAKSTDDSSGIARALTGLAQAARKLGDLTAARQLGEEALALKLRFGAKTELFRSYNALGLLAWDEERLSDASALFTKAGDAAREVGDSAGLAKAALNMGLVLDDRGDFNGARAAYVHARDAFREQGDTLNLGRALNDLASLDVKLGDPLAAIASLEQARLLFRASGDSAGEVNARAQLATAYDRLGEPQRAFALLDSAAGMARRLHLRTELADDLKLIGDLFQDAGDHQHARRSRARAGALNDSLSRPEERGNLLRNEARAYFALGNRVLASSRALEARRVHRAGGFRYPELGDLILLAELAQEAKRPGEAEAYLRSAQVIASSFNTGMAVARVTLAEARLADRAGQPQRVLRRLTDMRGVLAVAGDGAIAEAAALRARAYARLNRLEAAAVAGRQAMSAVERVRGSYGSGELRTSYASDKASVYSDLAVVLLRLGRTDEAFQVADAARGRALLEHLSTARGDVRLAAGTAALADADALLHRIDLLVAKLRERDRLTPRERSLSFAAVTQELSDSLRAARTEYETLIARSQGNALSTRIIGGSRVAGHELQASLRPGEVLVEYFVTPERLIVFVVTPSALMTTSTALRADSLTSRVSFARELLGSRDQSQGATAVLRALYEMLFAPVVSTGALGAARTLIIVPHRVLTYLPFGALVNPATGKYVAETHSVMYAPTAAAFHALRRSPRARAAERPARAAAFAPFPEALPASRDEARGVASTLPGTTAYIGAAATEGELRRALQAGALVHVASHALMNVRNPLFSRIELAGNQLGAARDNGRLEVHELLDLHFDSKLAFLSGCETALGSAWSTQFETGEDYATAAQALLYAGAQNVIATLWRIDDVGGGEFAKRFYAAFGHATVPDALAEAQRSMIADPRFRSPYYWAAYELSGSGIAVDGGANGARSSVEQ
jgi:CHAT domain-containing protein